MKDLIDVMEPMANALVTAVGNGLWQGLALALCVGCAWRVFKRSSASTRFVVWWITLLAVVFLPFVQWAANRTVHATNVFEKAAPAPESADFVRTRASILPLPTGKGRGEGEEDVALPVASMTETGLMSSIAPTNYSHATDILGGAQAERSNRLSTTLQQTYRIDAGRWPLILVGVWLFAASVLTARLLRGCCSLLKLKKRSISAPPVFQERFAKCVERLAFSRDVVMYRNPTATNWPSP